MIGGKLAVGFLIFYLACACSLGLFLSIKIKQKNLTYEIPIVAYFYSEEDYYNNIEKLEKGIDYSNEVYKDTNVKFVIVDVLIVEYDSAYDGAQEEQIWMAKHSDAISIYSVEKITLKNKPDESASYIGVAYEYGQKSYCAIVYNYKRSDATIAHELGHVFGLSHDHENNFNIMYPNIEMISRHIIVKEQKEIMIKKIKEFLWLDND